MKNPPIEREEIARINATLAEFRALSEQRDALQKLHSVARAEAQKFADTGDLSDLNEVSASVARRTQADLLERRIAKLNEQLDALDTRLMSENEAAGRIVSNALSELRNAVAEKAAQVFLRHFSRPQEARRAALASEGVREVDKRMHAFSAMKSNLDAAALAEAYQKLLAEVEAEIEPIRKEIGGTIPTLQQLQV